MTNEDEAIEEGRLWHVVVNGSWHWYGHYLLGSPALSCGLGNSSAPIISVFLVSKLVLWPLEFTRQIFNNMVLSIIFWFWEKVWLKIA